MLVGIPILNTYLLKDKQPQWIVDRLTGKHNRITDQYLSSRAERTVERLSIRFSQIYNWLINRAEAIFTLAMTGQDDGKAETMTTDHDKVIADYTEALEKNSANISLSFRVYPRHFIEI